MSLTLNQKLNLLSVLAVNAAIIIFGIVLWNKSNIEPSDLSVLESKVKQIGLTKIRIGRGTSTTEVIYLELEGLNQLLGLNHLDEYTKFNILSGIKIGDTIKVLFNESGPKIDEGLNLFVYKVVKNDNILLDIKDFTAEDYELAKLFFITGLLFMIAPILMYRHFKKITPTTIKNIKNHLKESGIECRIT